METLNKIVLAMNKEELRYFKLLSNKSHETGDRKDLALFDYIRRSSSAYKENKIFKKLYETGEKNAFYRLKNRLLSEIGKSLLLLHWEDDETLETLNYLSLAILFKKKQQQEEAAYFLKKAEKKAEANGNLELLDIIYGEYIQLSYILIVLNPEEYILKREENRENINRLREIDNIIAVVSWQIKVSGNLATSDASIRTLLEKSISQFSKDESLADNLQFKTRTYQAVSKLLIQDHQYERLGEFVSATLNEFNQKKLFSRNNHELKLQMITNMVNALLKTKKYDEALVFTGKLFEALQEHGKLLYEKYLVFYYNSLANIWTRKDLKKAVTILTEMLENPILQKSALNILFIQLNLAVTYYGLKKTDPALKTLAQIRILDSWKKTDPSFRMKVGIFELAATWDQGEEETLDYKMRQFRTDFKDDIGQPQYEREDKFLEIMSAGNEMRKGKPSKQLPFLCEAFLKNFSDPEDDLFNYSIWVEQLVAIG